VVQWWEFLAAERRCCLLWFTNWIYICYVEESRPPLWSSGQSSCQQNRGPDSIPGAQIFWKVVCLERGPPSLVSTIEELLERKSSGSGLESREYGHREPSRWSRGNLYPQKLALNSPTSGCRSVGIVRSCHGVLLVCSFCGIPVCINSTPISIELFPNEIRLSVCGTRSAKNVLRACFEWPHETACVVWTA
jgi:hypothetical protein